MGVKLVSQILASRPNQKISDIQVRSDHPVYIHTERGVEIIRELGIITTDQVIKMATDLYGHTTDFTSTLDGAPEKVLSTLLTSRKVLDFACQLGDTQLDHGRVRLRVQMHLSESGVGFTCRVLHQKLPKLKELGIEPFIIERLQELVQGRQGLGFVTGQTGSGKTTTLAAMIDWLRSNHQRHIVTVEDPIEYYYDNLTGESGQGSNEFQASPSLITQQEVGRHTDSFSAGIIQSLRKAPHVLLLGEVRDRASMDACLEAAQTGHLVLTTLHTRGAVKTLDRILEFYPKDMHHSILNRIYTTISFILSQGLLPGFNGRVLITEYLENNSLNVASGIRFYDGSAPSLADAIRQHGNLRWDDCLKDAFRRGAISEEIYRNNLMQM